jgi:hypothetical protein
MSKYPSAIYWDHLHHLLTAEPQLISEVTPILEVESWRFGLSDSTIPVPGSRIKSY